MSKTDGIQLGQIRKIEHELFYLIGEQTSDRINERPFNQERAKRIDDLQNEYARFCIK